VFTKSCSCFQAAVSVFGLGISIGYHDAIYCHFSELFTKARDVPHLCQFLMESRAAMKPKSVTLPDMPPKPG
jgi:hypothetical protein